MDVMSRDPLTIDPDASLGTAVEVMRAGGLRHLPVVDGTGALLGIITDRDLRHAALAPAIAEGLSPVAARRLARLGPAIADLRVRDAMTWDVVTTHPEASLTHAALLMFERRVGSLPVVEKGRLVGILTERDLLRVLIEGGPVREFDPEGFLW
jgi:acetoin utilization protein AcuB